MSLRGLLSSVAGGTLLLALLVSYALSTITSRMEHNTRLIRNAAESVRAAEEISIALLVHSRERRLLALTGEQSHAQEVRNAREQLQYWLSKSEGFVGGSVEKSIFQELQRDTAQYLERVAQLQTLSQDHMSDGPEWVNPAFQSAKRLVDINLDDARRVEEETQRWNVLANRLGLLASVALVIGIGLSLGSVRRYVYGPLLAIRNALVRFHLGAPGASVPEAGPVELRDISREFNGMASRLERQREVQLHFIAGVAHDLRNPLSALKLSAESIRPERPLPPEEKLRERFGLVNRQVKQLIRMVDDLLDTARIEAGQLELRLEELDLRELVRDAVALHEGVSPVHTWAVHLPEASVRVRCDATRLSQVLNNLLSNALKYSPRGGSLRVELTATPDSACVAVTDAGVGIPASELESIFEPFRRSTTTRDTIPGVGLGLAVGRRIIQAHGGSIEVESHLGEGSTFRFKLPRVPPPGS